MFDITTDHERHLLRIALRGFWDDTIMASYMAEVREKGAELERTGGCKYILINMVDYEIQSKEVAEAHAENLRRVKKAGVARVALVMQSALSRLQAARVAVDTGHQAFDTEDEALEWLLASD